MRWTRRTFLGAGALAALGVAACARGSGVPDDAEVVAYGEAHRQRFELTRPTADGPAPVVVLLHGGFWSNQYDLDLMRPLVPSLVAQGWAVANVEYRSLGDVGGGWPATFTDVAAAVDALAGRDGLDAARVVTVGHSAGGHLAVWAAARGTLPDGLPGAGPQVRPIGAVAQAGVLDLVAAADQGVGGRAVVQLLGGVPGAVPEVYALASPVARVPIGVPVELVHGPADQHVPLDQSRRYLAKAQAAGDPVRLTEVPGDHFALIDPGSAAWRLTLEATARVLA